MPQMVHNFNRAIRTRMLDAAKRRRVQLQQLRSDMSVAEKQDASMQNAPAAKPAQPAKLQ